MKLVLLCITVLNTAFLPPRFLGYSVSTASSSFSPSFDVPLCFYMQDREEIEDAQGLQPQETTGHLTSELRVDLARLCRLMYQNVPPFDPYILVGDVHKNGYRAKIVLSHTKKRVVIAFRGTYSSQDLWIDLAILLSETDTYQKIQRMVQAGLVEGDAQRSSLQQRHDDGAKDKKRCLQTKVMAMMEWLHPAHMVDRIVAHRLDLIFFTLRQADLCRKDHEGYEIFVTGHSLGGLYANLVSLVLRWRGASYNPPGATTLLYHSKWRQHLDKLEAGPIEVHMIEGDWVATFGGVNHRGLIFIHPSSKLMPVWEKHSIDTLITVLKKEVEQLQKEKPT